MDSYPECPQDRRDKERRSPDGKKSYKHKASQRGLLGGYNSLEGHTWPGVLSALQIPVVSPVSRTKTSVESLIGGWHYASRHCYGW